MPLSGILSKVTGCLSYGKDFAESKITELLASRYPDLSDVMVVMDKIKARVKDDDVDTLSPKEDDGKWRPALLTVALLVKLQKLNDHMEDPTAAVMSDNEAQLKLLLVFGAYWHICTQIGKGLRSFEHDSQGKRTHKIRIKTKINRFGPDENCTDQDSSALVEHLAANTGLPPEDILVAHSTDAKHLEGGHCPDFAVVVIHHHQVILINVCGTRMIPQPKMSDVFMDLAADAVPFIEGRAHKGMAVGTDNILAKAADALAAARRDLPDYGVLVTGYSLGAGIAPLLTMKLLSGEVDLAGEPPSIRCISYGAPPVYEPANGAVTFAVPNIYNVVNDNDGLTSASLNTVIKFFEQIKAVDDLQLGRRQMFKMLTENIQAKNGDVIHDDDDDDDDDAESVVEELPANWQRIQEAVLSVEREDTLGIAKLDHPAGKVYRFKKRGKDNEVVTRVFEDTRRMTNNLRVKTSMLNHHMPWGYSGLFENYGTDIKEVSKETFQEVLAL